MKEIKFKQPIWEDGKIVRWHYWGYKNDQYQHPINLHESYQYIGIKDKKGKEIFDGDKVKFSYYEHNERLFKYELIKNTGIVTFVDWLGAWCILFEEDCYVQIKLGEVEFEVIEDKVKNTRPTKG